MGTAPSTKKAADADVMNTIVPSLTPNVSRMSGASTVMTSLSSSSRLFSSSSTTKVNGPALLSPSRRLV